MIAPGRAAEAAHVAYGRVKLAGAALVGGMIAFQSLPDLEQRLLGPAWLRPAVGIVLGAFYALEKYLQLTPAWHKAPPPDAPKEP